MDPNPYGGFGSRLDYTTSLSYSSDDYNDQSIIENELNEDVSTFNNEYLSTSLNINTSHLSPTRHYHSNSILTLLSLSSCQQQYYSADDIQLSQLPKSSLRLKLQHHLIQPLPPPPSPPSTSKPSLSNTTLNTTNSNNNNHPNNPPNNPPSPYRSPSQLQQHQHYHHQQQPHDSHTPEISHLIPSHLITNLPSSSSPHNSQQHLAPIYMNPNQQNQSNQTNVVNQSNNLSQQPSRTNSVSQDSQISSYSHQQQQFYEQHQQHQHNHHNQHNQPLQQFQSLNSTTLYSFGNSPYSPIDSNLPITDQFLQLSPRHDPVSSLGFSTPSSQQHSGLQLHHNMTQSTHQSQPITTTISTSNTQQNQFSQQPNSPILEPSSSSITQNTSNQNTSNYHDQRPTISHQQSLPVFPHQQLQFHDTNQHHIYHHTTHYQEQQTPEQIQQQHFHQRLQQLRDSNMLLNLENPPLPTTIDQINQQPIASSPTSIPNNDSNTSNSTNNTNSHVHNNTHDLQHHQHHQHQQSSSSSSGLLRQRTSGPIPSSSSSSSLSASSPTTQLQQQQQQQHSQPLPQQQQFSGYSSTNPIQQLLSFQAPIPAQNHHQQLPHPISATSNSSGSFLSNHTQHHHHQYPQQSPQQLQQPQLEHSQSDALFSPQEHHHHHQQQPQQHQQHHEQQHNEQQHHEQHSPLPSVSHFVSNTQSNKSFNALTSHANKSPHQKHNTLQQKYDNSDHHVDNQLFFPNGNHPNTTNQTSSTPLPTSKKLFHSHSQPKEYNLIHNDFKDDLFAHPDINNTNNELEQPELDISTIDHSQTKDSLLSPNSIQLQPTLLFSNSSSEDDNDRKRHRNVIPGINTIDDTPRHSDPNLSSFDHQLPLSRVGNESFLGDLQTGTSPHPIDSSDYQSQSLLQISTPTTINSNDVSQQHSSYSTLSLNVEHYHNHQQQQAPLHQQPILLPLQQQQRQRQQPQQQQQQQQPQNSHPKVGYNYPIPPLHPIQKLTQRVYKAFNIKKMNRFILIRYLQALSLNGCYSSDSYVFTQSRFQVCFHIIIPTELNFTPETHNAIVLLEGGWLSVTVEPKKRPTSAISLPPTTTTINSATITSTTSTDLHHDKNQLITHSSVPNQNLVPQLATMSFSSPVHHHSNNSLGKDTIVPNLGNVQSSIDDDDDANNSTTATAVTTTATTINNSINKVPTDISVKTTSFSNSLSLHSEQHQPQQLSQPDQIQQLDKQSSKTKKSTTKRSKTDMTKNDDSTNNNNNNSTSTSQLQSQYQLRPGSHANYVIQPSPITSNPNGIETIFSEQLYRSVSNSPPTFDSIITYWANPEHYDNHYCSTTTDLTPNWTFRKVPMGPNVGAWSVEIVLYKIDREGLSPWWNRALVSGTSCKLGPTDRFDDLSAHPFLLNHFGNRDIIPFNRINDAMYNPSVLSSQSTSSLIGTTTTTTIHTTHNNTSISPNHTINSNATDPFSRQTHNNHNEVQYVTYQPPNSVHSSNSLTTNNNDHHYQHHFLNSPLTPTSFNTVTPTTNTTNTTPPYSIFHSKSQWNCFKPVDFSIIFSSFEFNSQLPPNPFNNPYFMTSVNYSNDPSLELNQFWVTGLPKSIRPLIKAKRLQLTSNSKTSNNNTPSRTLTNQTTTTTTTVNTLTPTTTHTTTKTANTSHTSNGSSIQSSMHVQSKTNPSLGDSYDIISIGSDSFMPYEYVVTHHMVNNNKNNNNNNTNTVHSSSNNPHSSVTRTPSRNTSHSGTRASQYSGHHHHAATGQHLGKQLSSRNSSHNSSTHPNRHSTQQQIQQSHTSSSSRDLLAPTLLPAQNIVTNTHSNYPPSLSSTSLSFSSTHQHSSNTVRTPVNNMNQVQPTQYQSAFISPQLHLQHLQQQQLNNYHHQHQQQQQQQQHHHYQQQNQLHNRSFDTNNFDSQFHDQISSSQHSHDTSTVSTQRTAPASYQHHGMLTPPPNVNPDTLPLYIPNSPTNQSNPNSIHMNNLNGNNNNNSKPRGNSVPKALSTLPPSQSLTTQQYHQPSQQQQQSQRHPIHDLAPSPLPIHINTNNNQPPINGTSSTSHSQSQGSTSTSRGTRRAIPLPQLGSVTFSTTQQNSQHSQISNQYQSSTSQQLQHHPLYHNNQQQNQQQHYQQLPQHDEQQSNSSNDFQQSYHSSTFEQLLPQKQQQQHYSQQSNLDQFGNQQLSRQSSYHSNNQQLNHNQSNKQQQQQQQQKQQLQQQQNPLHHSQSSQRNSQYQQFYQSQDELTLHGNHPQAAQYNQHQQQQQQQQHQQRLQLQQQQQQQQQLQQQQQQQQHQQNQQQYQQRFPLPNPLNVSSLSSGYNSTVPRQQPITNPYLPSPLHHHQQQQQQQPNVDSFPQQRYPIQQGQPQQQYSGHFPQHQQHQLAQQHLAQQQLLAQQQQNQQRNQRR